MQERAWAWFAMRAHTKQATLWLCFLSYIEPFLSPIVPETLMAAMILAVRERWKYYAALTIFFTFLGGVTGYVLGMFIFEGFAKPLLEFSGFKEFHKISQQLLGSNIFFVMFFIALTLLPDKPFTYISGFIGAPFLLYAAGLLFGRTARVVLVAYLTYRFGPQILDAINKYFFWFAVAILAFLALYGIVHWSPLGF